MFITKEYIEEHFHEVKGRGGKNDRSRDSADVLALLKNVTDLPFVAHDVATCIA